MNNNPKSKLWLCKTNLENDYKNTLTFSSVDAQRNYFIGNPLDPFDYGVSTKSYTDYTYLRLEQFIKVSDFIEDIDTNNYLVLLNENKYYYYFITSMQYIDDETTRINIELDVMQTYFFDITYKNTFVEREHVTDDTAGKHTIPENVELGSYITQTGSETTTQLSDLWFLQNNTDKLPVFAVTRQPDGTSTATGEITPQYNGTWSGLWYMVVNNDEVDFARAIQQIDNTADCEIYAIFMAPAKLVNPTHTWRTGTDYNFKYCYVSSNTTYENIGTISVNKENHLDANYTPRNKKLLTYPYCYFSFNNLAGQVVNYKYEDFTSNYCKFEIIGCTSVGCDIKLKPTYLKSENPLERNFYQNDLYYTLDMYKLPTCGWVSDAYTNWLTQNGVNIVSNTISNIGNIALGAAGYLSGNLPLGIYGTAAMMGGLHGIKDQITQRKEAEITPDAAHSGNNMGNLNFALGRSFVLSKMTIREEYAKIIDKYFDMFGYQVNILKTPSIHTRLNWNYLKTNSCNFTGNIPQQYMDKIKTIFDNGITFWHNPTTMLDYSQANTILS